MLKKIKNEINNLQLNMKNDSPGVWKLYLILRTLVFGCIIRAIYLKNYEYLFLCILSLILFLVPSFIEKKLHITFPSTFEKIVLLFIFSAEILGEMGSFYIKFFWWDTMLHTLNGFLCAALGFALIDILNDNKTTKIQLSPMYCAVCAFCFSMTIGVMWEFFEYGMDNIFNMDMQKDTIVHEINTVILDETNTSVKIKDIETLEINGQLINTSGYIDIGLHDTMSDLIVNFIGAIIFSTIGFIHIKTKGKNKIAKHFIPIKNDHFQS